MPTISSQTRKIRSRLPQTMLRDREALSHRLKKLNQRSRYTDKGLLRELSSIEKKVESSIQERKKRMACRPAVTVPKNLPIFAKSDEIIHTIKENKVLIISGATGSGKSTQIPKICLEAGRGIKGMIGCTQPRRIATITIARRIAEELGEVIGRSAGFKIRFSDKTSRDSYIKIMTDGILLAETQSDPRLYEYDTLIIDEAHERSLNIDFLLGILKTLLHERQELKVIISSATLDTKKFSDTFDNAPVIEVGGRMYPVELEYRPLDPELEDAGKITYVDKVIEVVDTLRKKRRNGDILVFMPTEQDIMETCERLEGRHYHETSILPLFARLPASQQGLVYSVKGPKIVVATNVAETSLTIPGIRYVIDTGLARISRYLPRTRTVSLPICPISRSSADQRKGRCGRVQKGICIRLYSEEDYESRAPFTIPEILRSNLAEVILRMIFLNLGHPSSFPFIDSPNPRGIKDGFDLLEELGAITKIGKEYALTERGRIMARIPLDPKISRMILEAGQESCVNEVAVIASALSIQDPRERPIEKAEQADQMHAPFMDLNSDFITLLNIWNRYHHEWKTLKTQNRMRTFCKKNFLSFPRMREWVHTHEQINSILKEHKIPMGRRVSKEISESLYAGIHKSVLSGFLTNIALKKEKNIFLAAKGREVMIFPGSTLFNKGCPWIVAAEMVKTSRLFARTAAMVKREWLEALGGDHCRSTYSDPHWEKNRGEVLAFEQVTLYGLLIVSRRPISYGPINPVESHKIFIQSALVQGNVREPLPFLTHNLELIKKITTLEDKVRRRGILVSESAMTDFYTRNLEGVYDIRILKKRIKKRGGDDFLRMREEDLLLSIPDKTELSLYPDVIDIAKARFKTSYKFAPGKEDDGVTIAIPSGLASRIPSELLEWGVPGLFREKVTALIKGLPKRYRKKLVPVSQTVDLFLEEMEQGDQSLLSTLAHFIYHRFGLDIPSSVWSSVEIPEYLKMRVSIIDKKGRELRSGRDINLLKAADLSLTMEEDSAVWKRAQKRWERTGIIAWDFGTLPDSIHLGIHFFAYPGLESGEEIGVNIRLFQNHEQALKSHKKGIQTLFSIHFSKDLKFLKRNLTLPKEAASSTAYFGGVKAFESSLYQSLLKSLFWRNIRSRKDFYDYAGDIESVMFEKGKVLRDHALKILSDYNQTRSILYTVEKANRANTATLTLCSQIRKDLDALVSKDFLHIYPVDRLIHIPRYLKAIQIRTERGANDPEKDRKKQIEVEVFIKALGKMIRDLSHHASIKKREAVEGYRWMVEEFKVSLFAQELKTLFPVSEKRLEERRKEIERMV
ncbi:MAG: ATP-dependent RNA helicase HrpA [Thermodesulfobacteriota bacterium]|nr:ATP-dependent RNA helicase HrpA [Thermodesulfobacteriota bacterium]